MTHRLLGLAALVVAGCSTAPQDTDLEIDGAASAPSFMSATSSSVNGTACAFSADQWRGEAADLLQDRINELGAVTVAGSSYSTSEQLEGLLSDTDELTRQHAALAINMAFDRANIFGVYSNFANAVIVQGPYTGMTAAALFAMAETNPNVGLADGMDLLNSGFADCIDYWYLSSVTDADGDGLPNDEDCDDTNPLVGTVLFYDDLNSDQDYFNPTDQLDDYWEWNAASTVATEPGQQAQVGEAESWDNYVVYAEFTSQGSKVGCGFDCMTQCDPYEPEDDCWESWEARALGILEVEITASGVATFTNTDTEYDICLSEYLMFDSPGSQGLALGEENESGNEYRVPAGGSIDVHYGSWTTANGTWEPYLDEADLWCYQNGTSLITGTEYASIGARLPDDLQAYINSANDTDGDGVDDLVDWVSTSGVQAQYNIWEYQQDHAVVVVGKSAETNSAGGVDISLTVQNRGAVSASATLYDTIPANWNVVSCVDDPDGSTANPDGSTTYSWDLNLDGCTDDCATVDEVVTTCEIAYALNVDMDIVNLPEASVDYNDGEDDETSSSFPAVAFDYDWDADGEVMCGETERWRAGILARTTLDDDQDEGFHGYRCALASNSAKDCYDGGQFLQIGEFEDGPEDDLSSECSDGICENPTFEQLARSDHDGTLDIREGDTATLEFWLFDDNMYCLVEGEDGVSLEAEASDPSFGDGTVGFSTLNMFGDYNWIKVCEAYSMPNNDSVIIEE